MTSHAPPGSRSVLTRHGDWCNRDANSPSSYATSALTLEDHPTVANHRRRKRVRAAGPACPAAREKPGAQTSRQQGPLGVAWFMTGSIEEYRRAVSGRDLSRRFYEQAIRPLVPGVPHAAALLGEGSEVLGFDDEVSTDHDFGPCVQLFVPPGLDTTPIDVALERLPARFDGFPVVYPDSDLLHDPLDLLTARRRTLAWYPDDVWRYVLAAGWLRVSQEEPFVGRTGGRGDGLGSRILAARVARDLVRIGFLVERRWAPYSKWLMTAFAQLTLADQVGRHLRCALNATQWREREAALCAPRPATSPLSFPRHPGTRR